jgi:hypothetical protein
MLALGKRDLAAGPEQAAAGRLSGRGARLLVADRPAEGVAEAAERPNEAGLLHIVAESRADDGDEPGQRGLGDERPWPQYVPDLRLREGLGPARDQQSEQVIGLRLQGNGLRPPEHLPAILVEGELVEAERHDQLLLHPSTTVRQG